MNKIIRIGILNETKSPPDRRVPFIPLQIKKIKESFPGAVICVQPSNIRCISDHEYADEGIELKTNLSDCDLLIGIKEVSIETLIQGKTYLFFSHTGKMQPHNRHLLQEMAVRKNTLMDYEYLTDENHNRLVAFGRWAGIVGAYNALMAYGERNRIYRLKPAHQCFDIRELKGEISKVVLPGIKILVSGGGRVAGGAMEILRPLKIREVKSIEFLTEEFKEPVVCRIDPWHYTRRRDGSGFNMDHFISHPDMYKSIFKPFTKVTDLFMACHYWDPASPVFMTASDMRERDFRIRVIADISCDVQGPIPSTIRASSIDNPFYGYLPGPGTETSPFNPEGITVMAVDNLPGELPRDASQDFGEMLINGVIPALLGGDTDGMIEQATILHKGKLTPRFEYLKEFLGSSDF